MDSDYILSLHAIETHDYFNIILKNIYKNAEMKNQRATGTYINHQIPKTDLSEMKMLENT